MLKWLLTLLVVLAAIVAALWFWIYRPQQLALSSSQAEVARLQAAAARDAQRLQELQSHVADLEAVRDELKLTSSQLEEKVREKESELQALHATQDELVGQLKDEIANKQVQVQRYRDQLRVDLVDELLFDSGESELRPAGLDVLRRVAGVLKKTQGRSVEVEGHTDNVPIQGALAKRFPTNWELSAARAVNVVRALQADGLAPERLSAQARSEYDPRASNDTEAGRRQNRRIEILLGPLPPAAPKAPAAR